MSRTRTGSFLGFGIALITAGLLLSLQSWVSEAMASFTTQADAPLELVVYPSVWTVSSRNSGSNMIAVKGINGFSGTATITVSGLPSTIHDRYTTSAEREAGQGGYYCSSHCVSAANGDFPFSLPITNGEWNTLGTSMMAGAGVTTESKTVTVTATANGQSVSKSFTLKLINDEPTIGPGGITYAAQANPDVVATVNDASWSSNGSEKYKLTGFAAGTSRTRQIDILNVTSEAKTVDILSNLSGSGLADVTTAITGSLSATSLSLGPNERKTIDVTVSPSASTPNGVYEVIFGIQQADGSNRSGVGLALGITGGTSAAASTSSSSSSTPVTTTTESTSSQSTTSSSSSSTPPASNAAAEAQAVVDSAQGEPEKEVKTTAKSQFKLSTNGVVMESKHGADPANALFKVLATGDKGSSTSYTITDDVDWLAVTGDPKTLKAGEEATHEIDITLPADMASGTHEGTITVVDAKDPKQTQKLKVSLIVSLFQFSLPAIFTEDRFVATLRPGFSYTWSTIVGNEGNAEAMVGVLIPIPSLYKLTDAQIHGPSGEIVAKEADIVAATALLKPGETRSLQLSLQIPPESVQFPGQPAAPEKTIKLGDPLPLIEPFIFSSVSPAKWEELKASLPADQLHTAAFAESFRASGVQLAEFRKIPAGVQLQSLIELATTHPTLANGLSSSIVVSTLRDKMFAATKKISQAERIRTLFGSLPPLVERAYAADQTWPEYVGQAARNVVDSFGNGNILAQGEGFVAGTAEKVIPFGLFKAADTPAFGDKVDYQVSLAVGNVHGIVQSGLAPFPGKGFFGKFDEAVTAGTVGAGVAWTAAGEGGNAAIGVFKEHYPDDVFGPMVTRRGKGIESLAPDTASGGFVATAQGVNGNWVNVSEIAGVDRFVDGEVYYGDRMDPQLARQIYPHLSGVAPALAGAWDPNHLSSTPDEGPINTTDPITYHIDFENLKNATAAATQVFVTLLVDADFDLGSVQFLSSSHPDHVKNSIDETKRELRWEFTGISLPPNVTPPQGEGYAEFSIRPKANLASGTELTGKASIVFDFNPAIETNTTTHVLDTVAPTAAIASAKGKGGGIQVAWSATDAEPGSGIGEVRLVASPTDLSDGSEEVVTESPSRLKVQGGKSYLVRAMAIDKAGNASPLTEGITVNVSRPWLLYSVLLLGVVGIAAWKRQFIWQRLQRKSTVTV